MELNANGTKLHPALARRAVWTILQETGTESDGPIKVSMSDIQINQWLMSGEAIIQTLNPGNLDDYPAWRFAGLPIREDRTVPKNEVHFLDGSGTIVLGKITNLFVPESETCLKM